MEAADRAECSSESLDSVISNNCDFVSLVRHELRRSERYCSFVSLVSILLWNSNRGIELRSSAESADDGDFTVRLWESVRSSVRVTDVVSRVSRDRIGLLLVETPKDGALALARRLKDSLAHFFDGTGELAAAVDFQIEVGTFPDDKASIDRLIADFVS